MRRIMLLHFGLVTCRFAHPKTLDFYDFEIFGRVSEPQNQQFLSLETPGCLNKIKKTPGSFSHNIIFLN